MLFYYVILKLIYILYYQVINRNNYGIDDNAKEFGIKVMNQLALVDARVLPPPRVHVFLFILKNNLIKTLSAVSPHEIVLFFSLNTISLDENKYVIRR